MQSYSGTVMNQNPLSDSQRASENTSTHMGNCWHAGQQTSPRDYQFLHEHWLCSLRMCCWFLRTSQWPKSK